VKPFIPSFLDTPGIEIPIRAKKNNYTVNVYNINHFRENKGMKKLSGDIDNRHDRHLNNIKIVKV
jgi:hypothetical protein